MAETVSPEVTSVTISSRNASMLHHELVNPEILSAVAPVVAESPRAIDESLLRERHEVTGGQEVGALQGPDGTKRPTRTTNRLIFDRCNLKVKKSFNIGVRQYKFKYIPT